MSEETTSKRRVIGNELVCPHCEVGDVRFLPGERGIIAVCKHCDAHSFDRDTATEALESMWHTQALLDLKDLSCSLIAISDTLRDMYDVMRSKR